MKKLIILLAIFFSSVSFACPDLSGIYSCFDDEMGNYTLWISQKTIGKETVIVGLDGKPVVKIDGKWRSTKKLKDIWESRHFCENNQLVFEKNVYFERGSKSYLRIKYSLNQDGDIEDHSYLNFNGIEVTNNSSCTRF